MAVMTEERGVGAGLTTRHRVSWGAIIAGTVLSLGLWLLLYVFGLAIGLTSVSPQNPGSLQNAGIGTGIWSLIAPLIALFIGGWVTARLTGLSDKASGAIHGAVVWALASLIGLLMLANVIGAALGGVTRLGGQALSAAGQGAGQLVAQADQQTLQALGINTQDLLGPVNERLRAAGKPAVTAQQLEASVQDLLGTAVREGRFDRELLISSIAQNTQLSRQDAQEVATAVETRFQERWQQVSGQFGGAVQRVQTGALKAADVTGKALWGVFGMLLLSLVSAVLGAITATGRESRRVRREPVATTREVHP